MKFQHDSMTSESFLHPSTLEERYRPCKTITLLLRKDLPTQWNRSSSYFVRRVAKGLFRLYFEQLKQYWGFKKGKSAMACSRTYDQSCLSVD